MWTRSITSGLKTWTFLSCPKIIFPFKKLMLTPHTRTQRLVIVFRRMKGGHILYLQHASLTISTIFTEKVTHIDIIYIWTHQKEVKPHWNGCVDTTHVPAWFSLMFFPKTFSLMREGRGTSLRWNMSCFEFQAC